MGNVSTVGLSETFGVPTDVTEKLTGVAAPPPGDGLTTETGIVAAFATFAAEIAAVSCVELTNVVPFACPLKVTTELALNPVPFTVSAKAAAPAWTVDGCNAAIAGNGLLILKETALDVPPPGATLVTVTVDAPAVATSAARIAAVSWVALTNVVVRGLPLKFTTELPTNFVPLTVSASAPEPAMTLTGCREVIAGVGLLAAVMVKVTAFDVPPPGAGLVTVTVGAPAATTSLASIAAVS